MTMERTREQEILRDRILISWLQTTLPLREQSTDPEVTLELLVEAAEKVKDHLQSELDQFRTEKD